MSQVPPAFCRHPETSIFALVRFPKRDEIISKGFSSDYQSIMHILPRFAALLLILVVSGCSASQLIGVHTADYRNTTAVAGDSQLLLNILRAKDNVPIHFYDLSIIHGSIQLTAGAAASVPFQLNGSATPDTIAPIVSAQTAPTFDVGTSDTQDFTRGILSPLDPRVVKALFDQGVDPRIMMLLFFSGYHKPSGKVLLNTLACDPSKPGREPTEGCYNQFYDYLDEVDSLLANARARASVQPPYEAKVRANIYHALRPVGDRLAGAWTLNNLGDLRQLDSTQYRLIGNRLYSISEPRLAICYETRGGLIALIPGQNPNAACSQKEVIIFEPPTKRAIGLLLRSTYDIIQFLGQVLRFQQEKWIEGKDRCLTLRPESRGCGDGEVLFQVNAPVGTPVISTLYSDKWYALYDRNCERNRQQPSCDYSIQVLAILELLINENRSAKDIISTPRVQVVP